MRFNPIIIKTGGVTPTPSGWERPADWIPIPSISTGEEVVYLLTRINNDDSNFVALLFKGDYTVDWGDGIIENVNSNVKAQHNYNYNDCGNLSILGYKQALIKVTPQSGQTLNYVNISQVYTGIAAGKSSKFLDVGMNIPNVSGSTNLYIGNMGNVYHRIVERIWIKEIGAVTTMYQMFNACYSLQSVPLFNTSAVTTMQQMFYNCFSLQSVPLFNTSAVTTMYQMFAYCYSLQSVPLFNTSAVTNMFQMFFYCCSLQSVPLFNTSAVTSMLEMFNVCYSLQSVPLFNTSAVTTMQQMFNYCYSLQSVPPFNTSEVTNMYRMFNVCYSLQSVPLFDTSEVTNMLEMFNGCGVLSRCEMTGTSVDITYQNCLLNTTAIDEIFTNLADLTGFATKTITVKGNIGASTCDTSIATAKNWTVII